MLVGYLGLGDAADGGGDYDELGFLAFLRGAEAETVLVGAGIVGSVFQLRVAGGW